MQWEMVPLTFLHTLLSPAPDNTTKIEVKNCLQLEVALNSRIPLVEHFYEKSQNVFFIQYSDLINYNVAYILFFRYV